MNKKRVIVAGGGAAGFFAAISCAEANRDVEVFIAEKGPEFLSKVRISGGGRCNVTNACFDVAHLCESYPRGGRALAGAFQVFQPRNTIEWFESRGVRLRTEEDGRVFPVTNSSQTIVNCLLREAQALGIKSAFNCAVEKVERRAEGGFDVVFTNGEWAECDCLLLATGGCRTVSGGSLPVGLGHTLETPVPSLFTFNVDAPWLCSLSGVAVNKVEISVPSMKLRETGAILLTHWGVSGPAVLRLSAWGARVLNAAEYRFVLRVDWLPGLQGQEVESELAARRELQPSRFVSNTPIPPLSGRLWEALVEAAGIEPETRWAALSAADRHRLGVQLIHTELAVTGKSTNKDEFVTCGGVALKEINFKTMESRICPGLFFAGELMDIDGITGGFNFQAAWTTGCIAGTSIAERLAPK